MVRSERERRGLSQAKLAEQAGVSTRTISDIETCNGNPELATLIPIAQFLDISIDAAVQDERKEPDTTTYQIMKELQNCSEDRAANCPTHLAWASFCIERKGYTQLSFFLTISDF
ncbi:MAG: helix-turn-helix domain-containing protein, partial [Blautia wexlerae]